MGGRSTGSMGTVFVQKFLVNHTSQNSKKIKILNRSGQRSFLFEKNGGELLRPVLYQGAGKKELKSGTITLHTNFVNYVVKSEGVENVFNIRY